MRHGSPRCEVWGPPASDQFSPWVYGWRHGWVGVQPQLGQAMVNGSDAQLDVALRRVCPGERGVEVLDRSCEACCHLQHAPPQGKYGSLRLSPISSVRAAFLGGLRMPRACPEVPLPALVEAAVLEVQDCARPGQSAHHQPDHRLQSSGVPSQVMEGLIAAQRGSMCHLVTAMPAPAHGRH